MLANERIFIALGSNIGDRLSHLGKGILYLSQHPEIRVVALSSVYETEPVGYLDQDPFYNMVVEVRTSLSPERLLEACLEIERRLGRVRTVKNGPRTLDLDLLFYGSLICDRINLKIPHPRLHQRAFVLVPLAELAADFLHPKLSVSVADLVAGVDGRGVRKLKLDGEGEERKE